MKKSFYKFIGVVVGVVGIIFTILLFYVFNIVDFVETKDTVSNELDILIERIDEKNVQFEKLLENVSNENVSTAKAISIIINHECKTYKTIDSLEELRVAVNVEDIEITDADGKVVAGTGSYIGHNINKNDVLEKFSDGLDEDNYVKTINNISNDDFSQYVAVSRLDDEGLVIISSDLKTFRDAFDFMITPYSLENEAHINKSTVSIIDKNTWTILSNSDKKVVKQRFQISKDKFEEIDLSGEGYFDTEYKGNDTYVFYKKHGDHVLISMVNKSDIYSRRNSVTVSCLICTIILSFTAILAFRKKYIDFDLEKNIA